MARIYLGNVKGPKGDTGATGATGPQGEAATIEVGSVSTTAYGNAAQVTNVGSSSAAKFNFVIPQGKPGEKTTKMGELTLDTITTSEDSFPSPSVGDSGATAFGKIVKWFADGLAALTSKLDANKVVDSQAVTEDGYALSAKQANPNISGSLAAQISTLNDSLTNIATPAFPHFVLGTYTGNTGKSTFDFTAFTKLRRSWILVGANWVAVVEFLSSGTDFIFTKIGGAATNITTASVGAYKVEVSGIGWYDSPFAITFKNPSE